MRGRALVCAFLLAGCAPAATAPTSATPRAATSSTAAAASANAAADLGAIKARGSLIVAIRVEAPPANRAMGDPAHAQKRDFEIAVATLVAQSIIGPQAKLELRVQGGDRIPLLGQGADIAMVVDAPTTRDRALLSAPYAGGAIVLAVSATSTVAKIEDLAGKSVGVAMDELGARDLAQAFFTQRNVAVTLDNYQGMNGAATALDSGKAAAAVGDGIGAAVLSAERPLRTIATIASRPYVIAVRAGATELAQAVSGALAVALGNGAIKDAAAKAKFPYTAP